ncbi:MAG: nitrogen fixation protein NifM [Alphaproteobacteria bacterium]|nr:nitrogen fixation protein NifM [Alphaproteobacteria bacterium]
MTEQDPGLFAYHVLRVAVEVYGKQPSELTAEQLKIAHAQAGKTRKLEDRVLASPEGTRMAVPDVAIDAAVRQIKSRYENEAGFVAAMAESGMCETDLRRALWRELAFDAVMSLAGNGTDPITDAEVEAFYADHPERFERPELRTARHILITVNPEFPENTPEVAHKRIAEIHAQAEASPETFGELATQHSECPSALEGGLLGEVPPGKLYPNLDAALFHLAEGEISRPLETEAGLHIVKCEAIRPGAHLSLDQVRGKIREQMSALRRKAKQKAWIASLP